MTFSCPSRYLRKAKRMSGVEIKQVAPSVGLGEGPYWSQEDKALLFVDIVNGDVHRLFLETGRHQVLHVGRCWGYGLFCHQNTFMFSFSVLS